MEGSFTWIYRGNSGVKVTYRIFPDSGQGAGLYILIQGGHWLRVTLERCKFSSVSSSLRTGAKWGFCSLMTVS